MTTEIKIRDIESGKGMIYYKDNIDKLKNELDEGSEITLVDLNGNSLVVKLLKDETGKVIIPDEFLINTRQYGPQYTRVWTIKYTPKKKGGRRRSTHHRRRHRRRTHRR
jgi:hypothetical protein